MNDSKHPNDMSFDELLVQMADLDKESLAWSVVKNAKGGDASALKLLQVVMERALYAQDDKLKISDDQFKRIIKLTAERLS